jgi:hypothetical protein
MTAPTVDTARTLRTHIDQWMIESRPCFDPFQGDDVEEQGLRRKAFVELSLFLYIADRIDPHPGFDSLRGLLIDSVNDTRFLDFVARDARRFDQYVPAMVYVNGLGALGPEAVRLARDIVGRPLLWSIELQTYRLLSLVLSCESLGIATPTRPAPNDIFPLMGVMNPPSAVDSTIGDAYTVTHDLFYLSDFGFQTPPVDLAHLRTLLPLLIVRNLADGHLDVALELAATTAMVHQLPQAVADVAIHAACREFRTAGRLRSPNAMLFDYLRDHNSPLADWASYYHTMLVAGYALRLIEARYDSDNGQALDLPTGEGDLMALGYALATLSRGRLFEGATWLYELRNSQIRTEWPEAFADSLSSIARQSGSRGDQDTALDPDRDICQRVLRDFNAACVNPVGAVSG